MVTEIHSPVHKGLLKGMCVFTRSAMHAARTAVAAHDDAAPRTHAAHAGHAVHEAAHEALGVGAGVAVGRDVTEVLGEVTLGAVRVLVVPLRGR
jgi:hypothetical protein